MNSVVEMYTMQNYLQPDALAARGIHNFDAWANQFAEVRTELQISPSGQGGRLKDTLSRYNNLNALQQMFSQFMDSVTEIPGLKIPKMKGGKRIVVKCEPSEFQRDYMNSLGERNEAVHARRVKPEVDNMLKIEADGRKICYSQRVMDPSLPYEPNGKIMKCSRNVFEEWKNSEGIQGTQIIFCDFSTPKSGGASAKKKGADMPADEGGAAAPVDDKLQKAIELRSRKQTKELVLSCNDGIHKLRVDEIYYIEVMDHNLLYHTTQGVFEERRSIKEMEEKLSPYDFVRASKSYLVNLKHISTMSGNTVTICREQIPIGRTKRQEFTKRLMDYLGDTIR